MSKAVFERLQLLLFNTLLENLPDHDERVDIDKEIEKQTGKYCDEGVKQLTDEQLKEIVERVRRRKKRVEVYA